MKKIDKEVEVLAQQLEGIISRREIHRAERDTIWKGALQDTTRELNRMKELSKEHKEELLVEGLSLSAIELEGFIRGLVYAESTIEKLSGWAQEEEDQE